MGFFGKQKISIEQVADTIAEMVATSNTHEHITKLLKESGQEILIIEQKKKEILIFEMIMRMTMYYGYYLR